MRRLISAPSSLLVLALVAVGCGSTEQPEAPPGQPIGPARAQDDSLMAALMEGGGATAEPTAKATATAEPTASPTATIAASAAPSGSAKHAGSGKASGTAAPKATAKPTATAKASAAPKQ